MPLQPCPWLFPLVGLALAAAPLSAADATAPREMGPNGRPVQVRVVNRNAPAIPTPVAAPDQHDRTVVAAANQPVTPQKAATDLKATTVTAHLREAHATGKNLLWCSSFQLAWDAAGKANGQDLKLDQEPAMAQALNEHLASIKDLDAGSVLAMAGYGRDQIVEKIEKALDAKFPGHDDFFMRAVGGPVDPATLVAFAYLQKNLTFAQPFFTKADLPLTFNGKEVKAFGVWNNPQLKDRASRLEQVRVIDYKSKSNFIVELQTKAPDDRLILARLTPGKTLKDTIDEVVQRMSVAPAEPPALGAQEDFMAPVIDFNILREYTEIEGRRFQNTDGDGFILVKALQSTRFKLNEKGAEIVSQAVLVAPGAAPAPSRDFYFNKPFLVLLLHKGAKMPYFALWVDNPELLTPNTSAADKESADATKTTAPDQAEFQPAPKATPATAPALLQRPLSTPAQQLPVEQRLR